MNETFDEYSTIVPWECDSPPTTSLDGKSKGNKSSSLECRRGAVLNGVINSILTYLEKLLESRSHLSRDT